MKRGAGILMPIFSLPNKSGFGTMGKEAYEFVDFLVKSKQTYWQILPINETDDFGSPFSSPGVFSGNPLFIDLEEFFKKTELNEYGFNSKMTREDYKKTKMDLLYIWFKRTNYREEIQEFINNNEWVINYANYMTIKKKYNELAKTPKEMKIIGSDKYNSYLETNKETVEFYIFTQYIFFKQWYALKKYVNDKGIFIIGDSPCNSSMDSVECFYDRDMYLIDEDLAPVKVAGVPPDYFSEEGQCWNTLIYNYELMKQDGYKYLLDKYRYMLTIYDYMKIDHFRGLEYYYTIPFGMQDGKVGEWLPGPAYEFIDLLHQHGLTNLILEDLGIISEGVVRLKEYSKFPGMKVFQFAFGEENSPFLPENYIENCVVYTGTHDNDTFASMLKDKEYKELVKEYLDIDTKENKDIIYTSIEKLYESVGNVVIINPQDLLVQGNKFRFNAPGTMVNNWMYNSSRSLYSKEICDFLSDLVIRTRR